MIQTFEFYGSGRQINALGRFFRYEQGADGAGLTALRVTIDGNRIGTLEPGDALELPVEATRWDIEPVSSGCVGVVRIGNVRITSDKLTGIVQTVDGGRARTIGGVAFAAAGGITGGAGLFSWAQLWNKSTDKNVFVGSFNAITSAAVTVDVGVTTSQKSAFIYTGFSKRAGGAPSSAADLRTWATNLLADLSFSTIVQMGCSAGITANYKPTEPVMLPPGAGMVLRVPTQAVNLSCSFEWFEERA